MALTHLKNAGLVDNDRIDFAKTRSVQLASEKVNRDRYIQVHRVTFTGKDGRKLTAITVNDATAEECSGSGVHVYVVARELGDTLR
jgi:hypothetical protein